MERTVKVGVIGCGGIANGKHLPSLKKLPEVELVAFCDIVPDRAEKAKKDFGTEDTRVYTDYKEMMEKETEIEVIHVCTPNSSHSEITCCALYAGKHVMCEKPMAKTTEQAEAMLKAAKETGKKLTIGYQNRFRNDSLYLKEVCKANELGEIYYAKAHAIRRRAVPTWGVFLDEEAQGGGPLIDIGTHALDLTLWMMDNYKPKSVKGAVYRKLADQKNTGNAWGDWDPEKYTVEDSAFGFITMENGATIVLESSWALNTLDVKEAKTTLCGTLGGADMEGGLRINNVKHGKQNTEIPNLEAGGVAFYDGAKMDPADLEAKQWIDAVLNDKEPLVKPEQAIVVTKILEAIYKSAETGETVYF